jgi:hypothetical protein
LWRSIGPLLDAEMMQHLIEVRLGAGQRGVRVLLSPSLRQQ